MHTQPTNKPTTDSPTTDSPTTNAPTSSPSKSPSLSPITSRPTMTAEPSFQPSENPSMTHWPSSQPSKSPTVCIISSNNELLATILTLTIILMLLVPSLLQLPPTKNPTDAVSISWYIITSIFVTIQSY
jgi:ABC-type uncharacterized transport system involved in gliding motility auxiliary subunit